MIPKTVRTLRPLAGATCHVAGLVFGSGIQGFTLPADPMDKRLALGRGSVSYAHLGWIGSTAVAIDSYVTNPRRQGARVAAAPCQSSVTNNLCPQRHKRERGSSRNRKRPPPIGTVTGAGGKDAMSVCSKAILAGCSKDGTKGT
jgi:hypothetical protein